MSTVYIANKNLLFTVGYEGRDIEEFVNLLLSNDIETLIDVREIPISRKRGFSKRILQQRLESENIEYIHIKSLGSPRHLRKKVYEDNDFGYFFRKYEEYLEECTQEINELYKIVNKRSSCLLCFERNPSKCHRSAVAQKVSSFNGTPLQVNHI